MNVFCSSCLLSIRNKIEKQQRNDKYNDAVRAAVNSLNTSREQNNFYVVAVDGEMWSVGGMKTSHTWGKREEWVRESI